MAKNTSVMGIYTDRTNASEAIHVLRKSRCRATGISVLSPGNQGSKDCGLEQRTRALEGAAAGAAVGMLIGAALAWFASGQNVAIPNVGRSSRLGRCWPLWLARAPQGRWVGSWDYWPGMLLPEYVARRYAGRIRRGGILMSVHCGSPEWCGRAKRALKMTGARNIASAPESAADYGTTDQPTERAPAPVPDRGLDTARPAADFVAHETKE